MTDLLVTVLVTLALAFQVTLIAIPIVAIVIAARARRQARLLTDEMDEVRLSLDALRREVDRLRALPHEIREPGPTALQAGAETEPSVDPVRAAADASLTMVSTSADAPEFPAALSATMVRAPAASPDAPAASMVSSPVDPLTGSPATRVSPPADGLADPAATISATPVASPAGLSAAMASVPGDSPTSPAQPSATPVSTPFGTPDSGDSDRGTASPPPHLEAYEAPAISPPMRPPPDPAPSSPPLSLEEKIGMVWFVRIGAAMGIVVAGYAFKYVVDNDWIGPLGRVGVGWLVGAGLLATGALLSRRGQKTHAVFAQGILGLGLALLLVTSYASFAFYHLLSAMVAFGIVAVLCAFGGALAYAYRSQAVLVLSLLAVFLNPVVLSTGVDRPFALFAYLIFMTSGALAVAVKLRFAAATWTSAIGVMVLFGGWYARFFDALPPPEAGLVDALPETLQGAYYPLTARWAPLLFAFLFPLQWAIAGLRLAETNRRPTGLPLILVASVAAHAAFAALLYDHPLLLGGALCLLGIGTAIALIREGHADWLGLPMIASFAVLVSLTGEIGSAGPLSMLLVTGGLSAIYFGFFFHSALANDRLSSPRMLALLGCAGLGLIALAALWIMPRHFLLFSAVLTGLSAIYLLVAVTGRSVGMLLAAFVVSLGGLSAASVDHSTLQPGLLAICGAWFLLYVAFVAYDLFVRNSAWSAGRLSVLSGAGLGFGALFFLGTPDTADLLRALLALGTGAVYLLVGLRMLSAGARGEDRALLPLGLALAFFTLTVGLLLTGPSVTVIWCVEGAVLAYLAARTRRQGERGHPGWLAGALVLFVISAGRMFIVDLPWLEEQRWLFQRSLGQAGTLLPTPFLHPWAWTLAALGTALLLSARFWAQARRRSLFRGAALGLVVLGHSALLALLIGEGRLWMTDLPSVIAPGLPGEEFAVVYDEWIAHGWQIQQRLGWVSTLVLGLYAVGLLVVGFIVRDRVHRLLGIALFGITLAKMGLVDIWQMETLFKIAVGGAVAALLLCGGFLYARFSNRIRDLLLEGRELLVMLATLGACTAGVPSMARAADLGEYAQSRSIEGVDAPGDYRLEVDPPLYGATRTSSPLADMRITGPDNREVPYFIRDIAPQSVAKSVRVRVLDPVVLPDGRMRALLDLGTGPPLIHSRVSLNLQGVNYLRATRVESSTDRTLFGLLAQGAYVFDITTGGPRAVRDWIAYPPTHARYLRVTLLPGADGQPLSIVSAKVMTGREPPGRPTRTLPLELRAPPGHADGKTLIDLASLPPGVPLDTLRFDISTSAFVRRVQIHASTRRQAWFSVGGGLIYRVPGRAEPPGPVEESLLTPVNPGRRPFLRLTIEDGDDRPLDVRAIHGRYRPQEIIFRAVAAGAHELYIGRPDDRGPHYDLAAQMRRSAPSDLRTAHVAALGPNPLVTLETPPAATVSWTDRHRFAIEGIIALVVAALLIWTVVLLRR